MILRKPYAFLIKHFRFIHLLMLVVLTLINIHFSDLYSLFSDLQKTSTYIYATATTYISSNIIIFIISGSILTWIIYWLFKEKNKPNKFYLFMLVFYLITFGFNIFINSTLKTMVDVSVGSERVMLCKDFAFMIKYSSYIFMAYALISAIGFNIKQFNFSKDIAELNIADEDSAEFEILIGKNNYKYARLFRRSKRELKYYFLENKIAILSVIGIIVVAFSIVGFYYYNTFIKKIGKDESTTVNGITYTIRNSYITSLDYNGNLVKKGYKFVIVDMSFYNSNIVAKSLDLTKIKLRNGELEYYPTTAYNSYFYDLGYPYNNKDIIDKYSEYNASLTFILPETTTSKKFTLLVEKGVESNIMGIFADYQEFDVKPIILDKNYETGNIELNQEFATDVVGQNTFDITFKGYMMKDTYDSKYIRCSNLDKCDTYSKIVSTESYSTNTMLIVDYDLKLGTNNYLARKFKDVNKFLSKIIYLKYNTYGTEYMDKINVIKNSDIDNKLFINVERKINKADNIMLVLKLRTGEYTIPLSIMY